MNRDENELFSREQIMKRYAMTVMLKDDPETIQKYEEYHANPWPETNAGEH